MQKSWLFMLSLPLLLQISCSGSPGEIDLRRIRNMKGREFSGNPVQQRLAEAIEKDNVAEIDQAIRQGADVNQPGVNGVPPLVLALAKQRLEGFRSLLAHGADLSRNAAVTSLTGNFQRPDRIIEVVLEHPDLAFLKVALEAGFDPNFMVNPGSHETLLFTAVRAESEQAVAMLLDYGADPNHENIENITPMTEAQLRRNMGLVLFLLNRGADPTIKDKWGYDVAGMFKKYGSRGVWPERREAFEKIIDELVKRGLLTRQDIVEADKPKTSAPGEGPPGITVIEHAPDSEIGRAILKLDEAEREANRREGR
jgi:ankyrin repeat protein